MKLLTQGELRAVFRALERTKCLPEDRSALVKYIEVSTTWMNVLTEFSGIIPEIATVLSAAAVRIPRGDAVRLGDMERLINKLLKIGREISKAKTDLDAMVSADAEYESDATSGTPKPGIHITEHGRSTRYPR